MSESEDESIGFLDLVTANDNCPYDPAFFEHLYPLYLPNDERPHGYLVEDVVKKLPWTSKFKIRHEQPRRVDVLDSSDGKETSTACNEAFAEVVKACRDKMIFDLRKELELFAIVGVNYPVRISKYASPFFGIIGQCAHLTAYTRTASGIKIWVARRSDADGMIFPNKLDDTVAGGVSAEETPFETVVREANEETSLPESLVRRDVQCAGCLTYMGLVDSGRDEVSDLVKPDMVHAYDIQLAEGVIPKPHDDEVKEFYLMAPEQVRSVLLRKEFKTNSAVVMLDFFIRHGIITADNERDYPELNMRLHRHLPFSTAPRL